MIREHAVSVDGRTLAVLDAGAEDGPAVFACHGTPGSALLWRGSVEDVESRGMRLVSYDRPGYGGSEPHPGRDVAAAAGDIAAIADALEIERFAVEGGSGGGPHALACGALLSDRVVGVGCLAGVAPYPAEGLDWLEGMGQGNLDEFAAALGGRETLEPFLREQADEMLAAGPEDLADALGSLLSPVDVAALTGEFAEYLVDATRRAIGGSLEGWIEDDLAFMAPWGFELADIRVAVQLCQGAQDRMVPMAHGRWLADRIPGVEPFLSEGDGHLTIQLGRIGDVHAWLLERFQEGISSR
jgi:pimeloyl-ACP methyl ester carboxylesterase